MKRGFAAMSPAKHAEIAKMGGRASAAVNAGHRFTSETAAAAGKLGGLAAAKKPGFHAMIGRRGGLAVSADPVHMSHIGRKGGWNARYRKQLQEHREQSQEKESAGG